MNVARRPKGDRQQAVDKLERNSDQLVKLAMIRICLIQSYDLVPPWHIRAVRGLNETLASICLCEWSSFHASGQA